MTGVQTCALPISGVPLVANDLPVLREVFGGAAEFAGSRTQLAAALRRALGPADPERRRRGQALAATYTWSAAADAHLRLYRALAGTS